MFRSLRRKLRRVDLSGSVGRVLLGVAALLVIIAFAARWQVERRTARALDRAAITLGPLGTLNYSGVSAGFDGELRVRGLVFYPSGALPPQLPPLISEEATVKFPDFLALVSAGGGAPPRRLTVNLRGLRLDTGSARLPISGNPVEADACGDVLAFEPVDLQRMGFARTRMDLAIGYRLEPARDELQVHARSAVGNAARTDLEFTLRVPGMRGGIDPARAATVGAVQELAYTVDAAVFYRARNRYCGGELEVDPEAAAEANVGAFITRLAGTGWTVAPELVEQYRRFVAGDATLEISARPETPLPLERLARAEDPAWLAERLRLRSQVGNEPAVDVVLRRLAPAERERLAPRQEEASAPPRPRIAVSGRWVIVPESEYPAAVGRTVVIRTVRGTEYTGELLEVGPAGILLSGRLPRGSAILPLSRELIRELRIYER